MNFLYMSHSCICASVQCVNFRSHIKMLMSDSLYSISWLIESILIFINKLLLNLMCHVFNPSNVWWILMCFITKQRLCCIVLLRSWFLLYYFMFSWLLSLKFSVSNLFSTPAPSRCCSAMTVSTRTPAIFSLTGIVLFYHL